MSLKIPPILILFSGLPGTGKTTLSQKTAAYYHLPLFSKDRFQSLLVEKHLAKRNTADGYYLLIDQAEAQLSLGIGVVLDAVFPLPGFRQTLQKIAAQHTAIFIPIFCYCSSNEIWEKRMQNRCQLVPNWTPVGWEEVLRLKEIFTPWNPQEVLFLDVINQPEKNFGRLTDWINSKLETY